LKSSDAQSDALTGAGEQTLIDLVQELVSLLSQDSLTTDEVKARIGSVVRDPGIPLPIELLPSAASVSSARLICDPESGLPYLVTLEPSPGVVITPKALRAIFGDYNRTLTDLEMPPEVVFGPTREGKRWQVVLIAKLELTACVIESARVTSIALRRDLI